MDKPLPLKQLEEKAREVGRVLKGTMPRGAGFVLVLFDYAPAGNMTYLSTGVREDTIKLLKELVEKLEQERS